MLCFKLKAAMCTVTFRVKVVKSVIQQLYESYGACSFKRSIHT